MSTSLKKHIAIFIPSMNGGGAERVIATLVNEFTQNGNNVDLILANANGPFLNKITKQARIIDLKTKRASLSIFGLINYIRNNKPDIILSALGYANVIATIANILSREKTPLILSEHSTLSATIEGKKNIRRKILPWLIKYTYPKASGIIAVSNGVADDIVNFTGINKEKIKVIYNPVVSNELVLLSNKSIKHEWFSNKTLPVILAAGRLNEVKDFDTLLRAFSIVTKEIPSRLVILGEGNKRKHLEGLSKELGICDRFRLLGFQDNPYKFMKNSTIFVSSSKFEALGNSIIEAMACGTPVVSTDCPHGPTEILEGGKWGPLVPVGNPEQLSLAIIKTLNQATHPNVSIRGNDFGVHKSVNHYLKYFEKFYKQ
jgi:glycosyltransferase involved in cell wall biosynthesis